MFCFRRFSAFFLCYFFSLNPIIAQKAPTHKEVELLLDAICIVESNGDSNAVGDNGASKGAFQIGRAFWEDALQGSRYNWDYDQCVGDKKKCRVVIKLYWRRYLKREACLEARARVHNGGPRGHHKNATIKHWKKVQRVMEKLSKKKSSPKPNTNTHTRTYRVKKGDTLYRIGKRHGVSWRRIATLNNIHAPYLIRCNEILKIP